MKTKMIVREALYQRWLLNEFQLWQENFTILYTPELAQTVGDRDWDKALQIVLALLDKGWHTETPIAALEIVRDMIAEVANQ